MYKFGRLEFSRICKKFTHICVKKNNCEIGKIVFGRIGTRSSMAETRTKISMGQIPKLGILHQVMTWNQSHFQLSLFFPSERPTRWRHSGPKNLKSDKKCIAGSIEGCYVLMSTSKMPTVKMSTSKLSPSTCHHHLCMYMYPDLT
jgi:hypothetical protein